MSQFWVKGVLKNGKKKQKVSIVQRAKRIVGSFLHIKSWLSIHIQWTMMCSDADLLYVLFSPLNWLNSQILSKKYPKNILKWHRAPQKLMYAMNTILTENSWKCHEITDSGAHFGYLAKKWAKYYPKIFVSIMHHYWMVSHSEWKDFSLS